MAEQRYARIQSHLTEIGTRSFIQAPRGGPRSFTYGTWLPVPPATERFIAGIFANGEPFERGGEGGPMFQIVGHTEMLRIAGRESRLSRAKEISAAAYQQELQLLAEEDRREVRRKARLAAAQPAVAAPAVAVAAAEVDETDDEPDHGADVEDADDDAEPLSEDGGDPVAATPSASSAAASSGVPGEKPSATPERVGRRSRGAGKAPTAPAGE
jgi:hypothetical protein